MDSDTKFWHSIRQDEYAEARRKGQGVRRGRRVDWLEDLYENQKLFGNCGSFTCN